MALTLLTFPVYIACGTVVLTLLFLVKLFIEYQFGAADEIPTVCFVGTPLSQFVLKRCEQVTRPFRTTFLTRNAHVQTILGAILPGAKVRFIRELVTLNDGGHLAIDWAQKDNGEDFDEEDPLLVVLTGLTGDAQGVSNICAVALSRGFRPVVFNKRGHGGTVIATPKVQTFSDPTDLHWAMSHIKSTHPGVQLTAAGYSAGSGLLLSYLGNYGSTCLVNAAVTISSGYDAEHVFNHCIRHPYDFILVHRLKSLLKKNMRTLQTVVDTKFAMSSKRIIEFEERLCCPIYGYKSMDEYWASNNPIKNIHKVAIPVLCISGLDDPICRKDCIQYFMFKELTNFMLVAPTRGGHCGFLEGPNLARWADTLCVDYLTAVLDYVNNCKDTE